MMRERSHAEVGEWTRVYDYFNGLCQLLAEGTEPARATPGSVDEVAAILFRLLTQRDFTYLTRKRCEPYRHAVENYLRRAIETGGPVRLYYDIGGGYRASLDPGRLPPSSEPGLGEMLALAQIRRFIQRAQPHCPVPIRFTLVVDNLCAHYVNGIPLADTEGYCSALRTLLHYLSVKDVDLLVESERVASDDYEREFEAALAGAPTPDALTPSAHENVERFAGRRMASHEARHHVARYAAGSATTEAGLARMVDGIRLTQRATDATLAFRPFPGGDQRMQCGEVGLAVREGRNLDPILLSSTNYGRVQTERVDVSEWSIPHINRLDLVY